MTIKIIGEMHYAAYQFGIEYATWRNRYQGPVNNTRYMDIADEMPEIYRSALAAEYVVIHDYMHRAFVCGHNNYIDIDELPE